MNMNNRIFRVNGEGIVGLEKTLELVFLQRGNNLTAVGFIEHEEKGLILCWYESNHKNYNKFVAPLKAKQCAEMVNEWLKTDFAKKIKPSRWCENMDHDGHNTLGWEVYVEDWGRVNSIFESICAIKLAYCWHGK